MHGLNGDLCSSVKLQEELQKALSHILEIQHELAHVPHEGEQIDKLVLAQSLV